MRNYFLLIILKLFLLYNLITCIDFNADNENNNYLSSFSTRSIIRVITKYEKDELLDSLENENNNNNNRNDTINNSIDNNLFEIQEFYDQNRGLGKLIIYNDNGYKTILYVRARENLFMEVNLSPDNKLIDCNLDKKIPVNGYFGLFETTLNLAKYEGGKYSHFIGPSILLYKFRGDLQAENFKRQQEQQQKSKININNNNTSKIDDEEEEITMEQEENKQQHRRRLIINPKKIEFNFTIGSSSVINKVIFKQSDFPILRSPLMGQLASYMSYLDKISNTKFIIDFLSIEELDYLSQDDSIHLDEFKLPTGFSCSYEARHNHLVDSDENNYSFDLKNGWANWINLSHLNRWSASYHSNDINYIFQQQQQQQQHSGLHLMLDFDRFLLRFYLIGKSKNVLDIKNEILYHMPEEKAINANSKVDLLDNINVVDNKEERKKIKNQKLGPTVRNDDCTIMSSKIFSNKFNLLDDVFELKNQNKSIRLNHLSLDRWRFFVGNTNSIIYLGQTRYKNNRLSHEFELLYSNSSELPILFSILKTNSKLIELLSSNKNEKDSYYLIGKFWFLSNINCRNFHNDFPYCPEPIILGFRIDLYTNKVGKTHPSASSSSKIFSLKLSEEIQLNDFNWEFNDNNLISLPFQAFELKNCPLNKLHLSQEVRWLEELTIKKEKNYFLQQLERTNSICKHRSELDEFIGNQLINYLNTHANLDISIINLERKSFPGIKMANYHIDLAEKPRNVINFKLIKNRKSNLLSMSMMKSKLIDSYESIKTQFECLTLASQYGNSKFVLFNSTLGCFIYENIIADDDDDNGRTTINNNFYDLYERYFEQIELSKSISNGPLKMFLSENQFDEINNEIYKSYKNENKFEACLGDSILLRDIRLNKLKISKTIEDRDNNYDNRKKQTLLVKIGFRFKELQVISSESLINSNDNDKRLKLNRIQEEVHSFVQCLTKCEEEPTCSSFSYCKYPEAHHEACQLSDLKFNFTIDINDNNDNDNKEFLELNNFLEKKELIRDAGCEIHAKDFLSKFDKLNINQLKKSDRWHLISENLSELDCASLCYSKLLKDESCIRFIHCSKFNFKCFHWLSHDTIDDDHHDKNKTLLLFDDDDDDNNNNYEKNLSTCNAYERKILNLYKRTMNYENSTWYSSNIDNNDDGKLNQEKIAYISKEKCAERCTLNQECQSFDSCFVTSLTQDKKTSKYLPNTFYRFDCILLSDSIFNGELKLISQDDNKVIGNSSDSEMNKEQVNERFQCNHYERTAAHLRLSSKEVREIVKTLNEPKNKITTTSYVTTLFGASILGLAIGVGSKSLLVLIQSRFSYSH